MNKSTLRFLTGSDGLKPFELKAGGIGIFSFSSAVYGRAVEIGELFELKSGFLESWNWDFQKKQYVLKLKPELKFHNGRDVNATDVEFMLLKGFLSGEALSTTQMLSNILGVEKIKKGAPYKSGMVEGLIVQDSRTLLVRLAKPNPSFLYTIARPVPSLVPPEEMLADLVNNKALPIGSGNYKVDFVDPTSSLTRIKLVDNVNYPKAPNVVELVSDGKSENIDISVANSDLAPPFVGAKRFVSKSPSAIGKIAFNFSSKLGQDSRFRKGVALLVDRDRIIGDSDNLKICDQLLPDGFWGRSKIVQKNDRQKAKQLIAAAMKDAGVTEVRGYHYSNSWRGKPSSTLQAQFLEIGIQLILEDLKGNNTFPENDQITTLRLSGSPSDFLDPLNMFSPYLPDSPYPKETMEDIEYSKRYDESSLSTSLDVRAAAVQRLSDRYLELDFAVPVFSIASAYWYNPNKIESLGDQGPLAGLQFEKIIMKK